MKGRLDKVLATCALISRTQAALRAGRVTVDGIPVRDGKVKADSDAQIILLDGKRVEGDGFVYLMLYKPVGVLSATEDKKGAVTAMDLLPEEYRKAAPGVVGRLDKDTTGLLLLTTDGELNHRLLAPGRHVDKTYRAQTDGELNECHVAAFAAGMHVPEDGKEPAFDAQPAHMELAASDTGVLTIHEGKFHQVKRMFRVVGREVIRLHRLSFGSLYLDPDLPEGAWRELTEDEIAALYADAQMR